MAKAQKPKDNQGKIVPAAELVGDHAANQSTALITQPVITIDASGAAPNAQQLSDFADDHGFPLLEQACETFMLQHGHSNIKAIRITAKDDGLRRAGQHHAGTIDHSASAFTAEQLDQLLAEPLLIVEFIAPEA